MNLFDLQATITIAIDDALERLQRLGNRANDVAQELNSELGGNNNVNIDTNQAIDGLEDVEQAAEDTEEALDDVADSSDESGNSLEVFGSIAKGITGGVAALGVAVVGLAGGFLSLAGNTREYREDMAKLEASFKTAGHTTEEATKTYKELYSVFGEEDRAVEAAQQISKLAKNEEEMAKMTNIATGAWAMWGDSLATESLMEAMNSTAKIGEVQGTLADALEWSGVNLEEFNGKLATMSTEEERSAYILDTLNGLYSESAEQYRTINAEVMAANDAQSRLTDSMAALGEKAEPIVTKIKEGFALILEKVLELMNNVDFEALGTEIANAFQGFVDNVLPAIVSGLQWIIDNKDIIIAGIVGIGAAFVAWKIVGIVQSVIKALQGMTLAQAALNLVMSLNPIGLVVAAIAGLVAAFVVLWNKSEGFRNFFIGMWDGIKSAVGSVIDWISEAWEGLTSGIKGFMNGIIDGINGAIGFINKIKIDIPDWVPEYGGKTIGFNLEKIPKLAQGGIVESPTLAMIGEDGKEAVVPLENNLGWIDKIVDKLNPNNDSDLMFNKLIDRLDSLEKAILSRKIYLNGNVLVGELMPTIDARLGERVEATGRGR